MDDENLRDENFVHQRRHFWLFTKTCCMYWCK